MRLPAVLGVLCLAALLAGGETVRLRTPLSTTVALPSGGDLPASHLRVRLQVPAGAPRDLRIGAWVTDADGRWWQVFHPLPVAPGEQRLAFDLGPEARLQPEGHAAAWGAVPWAERRRVGLVFASDQASSASIAYEAWSEEPSSEVPADDDAEATLCDLALPPRDAEGRLLGRTGERLEIRLRPRPWPEDPWDERQFSLSGELTTPDGEVVRLLGFHDEPVRQRLRGDREEWIGDGEPAFALRLRPRRPGLHRLRLRAVWGGPEAHERILDLPITVTGQAWDDYVHVDAGDPRFFSIGDEGRRFFWALGLNLRSVNDPRGARSTTLKRVTPDLGSAAYAAYLQRLGANGGTAAEVWMSSWNLALEWRRGWPGYRGVGRYHPGHAAALDAVLDAAWAAGVRINLVVYNHGMGSERTDREWDNSPFNKANGGPFPSAASLFTDPVALAYQERYRRHLVARYADHPAILGWKLWSEINLTAGGANLRPWHEQATARWKALDPYRHPLTTHWAGDYHSPGRDIVALPGLDYVCIDAYHGRKADRPGILLAQLVRNSTLDPAAGLGTFGKPVLITEFGGSAHACPEPQLLAEHATGPWAAAMSGQAGGPMLWWFEWVDQYDRYQPYRAVSRFLAGEDLRGPTKAGRMLTATSPAGALWASCWAGPGDLLAYVLDQGWGYQGGEAPVHERATLTIGAEVKAGRMRAEWWDADTGTVRGDESISHPGSRLELAIPVFQRHLALKLRRLP